MPPRRSLPALEADGSTHSGARSLSSFSGGAAGREGKGCSLFTEQRPLRVERTSLEDHVSA